MQNNLRVFENERFGEVRTVVRESEIYFVAADVAAALDYSETSVMLRRLDVEDKMKIAPTEIVGTNNMTREMTIINESGLYSAILGSTKESAKDFKRWVTAEILPTLRKTGQYVMAKESDDIILAKAVLVATEKIQKLEENIEIKEKIIGALAEENEKLECKAELAIDLESSINTVEMGQAAANIQHALRKIDKDFKLGRNDLFKYLRENNYLIKFGKRKNNPNQRSLELKIFELETTTFTDKDGKKHINYKTLVTAKGIKYLIEKFKQGINIAA